VRVADVEGNPCSDGGWCGGEFIWGRVAGVEGNPCGGEWLFWKGVDVGASGCAEGCSCGDRG
jgi:hypothetical protein